MFKQLLKKGEVLLTTDTHTINEILTCCAEAREAYKQRLDNAHVTSHMEIKFLESRICAAEKLIADVNQLRI